MTMQSKVNCIIAILDNTLTWVNSSFIISQCGCKSKLLSKDNIGLDPFKQLPVIFNSSIVCTCRNRKGCINFTVLVIVTLNDLLYRRAIHNNYHFVHGIWHLVHWVLSMPTCKDQTFFVSQRIYSYCNYWVRIIHLIFQDLIWYLV